MSDAEGLTIATSCLVISLLVGASDYLAGRTTVVRLALWKRAIRGLALASSLLVGHEVIAGMSGATRLAFLWIVFRTAGAVLGWVYRLPINIGKGNEPPPNSPANGASWWA